MEHLAPRFLRFVAYRFSVQNLLSTIPLCHSRLLAIQKLK